MEEKKEKTITYVVDDEIQHTEEKVLTPKQILENAGIDPNSYYLVQIMEHEKKSYRDNPNEEIHMHPNMKFISIFVGETPVSKGL